MSAEGEGMVRQVAQRTGSPAVFALTTVLLAGLAGCGPSGPETMLAVEGQVRFGGKPLTKGTVVLYADPSKGNTTKHEPRGTIEADGRYQIFTHPHQGAPPGWYKVAVIATEPSDPKNPYALPRSLLPEKFSQPDESRLTLEVRSRPPPGAYDLDLK
jgi:hypothetical protein